MGFTEANNALSDMAPLVPEKYKSLGHQGVDGHACIRFSSMVYAGYLFNFGRRNWLFGATAASGTFHDGEKQQTA